jgi:hypothetical protein
MKHLLTFIFAFLVQSVYFGQITQVVRGVIIDKYSELTLPGMRVYLFTKTDTLKVASNATGEFRFSAVPVGRFSLLVSGIGYEDFVAQNYDLNSGKELVLTIKLTEKINQLNEVLISAKKEGETINKMATTSARSFSVEESQRFAGSLNDVARMAQNFAGVQGADDSRNDIIIRGNSPTGVLYRLDGIDIPNPNHFARFGTTGGPISMLNNNVLSNSDFFTGAFPAEYGNALSGVFDLKMRKGNNETHEFMGQIGFNGLEAMAEGPFSKKSKASYLVSYRYSTLELFKLIGINFGTTATPKYQDISFKLAFPHKNSITQIIGIGGLSNINLLAKEMDTENALWGFAYADIYFGSNTGLIGVTHKHRLNASSFLEFSSSFQSAYARVQNDTMDLNFENVFTTFVSASYNNRQSNTIRYQNKWNSRNVLETGITGDVFFLNLNDSIYDSEIQQFRNIRSFKGNTFLIRPFVQHKYRWTEKLTLVSGIYSQVLTLNSTFSIEPRVGMTYEMRGKRALSLGYGIHSQMHSIELYFRQVRLADGTFIKPNLNLDFTKSQHLIASFQQGFKHGIRSKVEVYAQYLWDVPVENKASTYSLLNFGSSFVTAFPDTLQNAGNGYNYGLELTVEKSLDKGFYFLVSASLFESKYKASNGKWYNTAFNSNYTLNVLGGYEIRFGSETSKTKSALTLDGKVVLNGGARYTPILVQESVILGEEIRDFSQANEAQYPLYAKLNVRIGFKLIGKKLTQEWAMDFQNLTNRRNIFLQEFSPYTGGIRTTYQTGFLPIMQYRIYL